MSRPPKRLGEIELVNMIGLLCPRCGFNWDVISNLGSNWLECGYDVHDLCDSQAEKDYYSILSPEIQQITIPQLFVEVAPKKGYFIDWYWPYIQQGVEIDGKQHLKSLGYDSRRDKALIDLGYKIDRISTGRLNVMVMIDRDAKWRAMLDEIKTRSQSSQLT
jgi:hypothetical protein